MLPQDSAIVAARLASERARLQAVAEANRKKIAQQKRDREEAETAKDVAAFLNKLENVQSRLLRRHLVLSHRPRHQLIRPWRRHHRAVRRLLRSVILKALGGCLIPCVQNRLFLPDLLLQISGSGSSHAPQGEGQSTLELNQHCPLTEAGSNWCFFIRCSYG